MATTDLKQIAPGVFAWQPGNEAAWGMANCGLVVSGDQALVIDTPYTPALTDAFLTAVRTAAGRDVPLNRVAVTHANGDHTWGLQQLPGAEVFATHATLEHQCLEPKPQQLQALIHDTDPGQPLGWYFREHFGSFDFAGIQVLPPTTTFAGRHDLAIGRISAELHEVGPAHTVGDLIVHLPEQRVVFAGDIVFAGDHPSHWAGPLEQVSAACARILDLEPEWIIPGHGQLMTPDDLQEYVAYLDDLAGQASLMHGQGRTAVEAARILIREDRYAGLGLPERLAITLSTEYRHLDQDSTAPDLLELMDRAARIAWERSTR
ncbi:MBL fold metallo-hydrolase [Streptomyces sp. TRM 70351]|uniref:MBL fold metallo-hydrolase n=1 Tax=Streptomyces sp. TRM 70351 TaxID=3116552 RepID=UPI002E7B5A2B|nr:MBL fold metallo-hydrolase [Streptomyces sp. TRM 70351]MEE1931254.1 MBL fold metallo-hydrolase [Streptomyces sp. TRM 70351]